MKKLIALFAAGALCLALVGCGDGGNGKSTETGAQLVSSTVVEPTCMTEGYTEKVYSDGYVCRDTFKPRTDHYFVEYRLGTDIDGLTRTACRYCGMERVSYSREDISTEVTIDESRPRPSFTDRDRMLVAMVTDSTADACIRTIRAAERTGAYSFMVYVSNLLPQERTFEKIQRIMYCTDLPVMALAYGAGTYEQIADLLKLSVRAGAAAVDLMGYTWVEGDIHESQKAYRAYWEEQGYDMSFLNANPAEVPAAPATIAKQIQFIDEIHELGGEVLLSMHLAVQMNAKQIIALGKYIEGVIDGVDIIKMVLSGSSKQTVVEHLTACITLEQELSCKFSVHGQSTLSRLMCPMFGSYIAFCIDNYTSNNIQVDLETMVHLFRYGEPQCDLETLVDLFDSAELEGYIR